MFAALLLICNVESMTCETFFAREQYKTEQECYDGIAGGITYYENQGLVVEEYYCHKWTSSFFDEKA
jgi:hypothetical protein|tara:strand:- start:1694 stop:1894 length:201 start_codon:yes stop_codon:yes gene_type:complete